MDCRDIKFSPAKSEERINRVLSVFSKGSLMRLLAFTLHLLGVRRQVVASMVGIPEESVKTILRLVTRDGFSALRDRRRSEVCPVAKALPDTAPVTARREGQWYIVEFGPSEKSLKIPVTFRVQARTVLLSLVNAGLLSAQDAATVLEIHASHCRELAKKLENHDVAESLLDKRQGLKQDYRFTPEVKSELIQQFALNVLSGWPTTGPALAQDLQERCEIVVSERSIRLQLNKLGLSQIADSLPKLLAEQKKTSSNS